MPQAVPLGRNRYVQYLHHDPAAPRREPATTHEVKGKKRHGEGVVYRLFGPHAVVLGRWMSTPVRVVQQDPDLDNWGRVVTPDEALELQARMLVDERFRDGWNPPVWHWRWYQERFWGVLNNLGLMNVQAYNLAQWTPRRFLRLVRNWALSKVFVHEEVVEFRERTVVDMFGDEETDSAVG